MPLMNIIATATSPGLGGTGSTLTTVISDLVSSAGDVLTTIVENPVLLIFLGLSVLGGVIGVLRRVIRVSRS